MLLLWLVTYYDDSDRKRPYINIRIHSKKMAILNVQKFSFDHRTRRTTPRVTWRFAQTFAASVCR